MHQLTTAARQHLLSILESLPLLDESAGRDALLCDLPPALIDTIPRSTITVVDLINIIRACEAWQPDLSTGDRDPLVSLLATTRDLVVGSEAAHEIQNLLDTLLEVAPVPDARSAGEPSTGSPFGPPHGTATFLFTDIVGSIQLWEQHPTAIALALTRYDALLRTAITEQGGHVFRMVGDACYAVFGTASAALSTALAAQRTLAAEPWGTPEPLLVRMALHTGQAEDRDGDYFGPPLNRIALLLAAGHGGQILLTAATRELVRDPLPPGIELRDLGEHRLKDLIRPEQVYQVLAPDLPAEFPPLKTLVARPNNLPHQPTALIGRELEAAAVAALLRQPDTALLTLTGPGGIGKTRLALQVAADLLEEFADGVFFVELAALTDPGLVISAMAHTLGINEAAGQSLVDILCGYLKDKQLLLLVDNFEQVVAAAPQLSPLLAGSPRLKLLVTSRAALHVRGEKLYPVSPLALPDAQHPPSLARLKQYAAVRLFIERATDVVPNFVVTKTSAPAVAEICARLDGLPLAIELAAARVRLLPPQAMLARLSQRLHLLTGGARDRAARQRTLRATISWSYDLLSASEQRLFCRLAVFQGGRTLEAIEAICNPAGDLDVLGGVQSLLDNSLLQPVVGRGDEPRFWMLETIQEYAREKLAEQGEAVQIAEHHAEYFLALAELAAPELKGADQLQWLARLECDHDNLRAAEKWLRETGQWEGIGRLGGALWRFWVAHSHLTEGRQQLEAVLTVGGQISLAVRAKVCHGVGVLAWTQGDNAAARRFFESALALSQADEYAAEKGILLNNLGHLAILRAAYDEAEALLAEAFAMQEAIGDRWGSAYTLNNLGVVAMLRGDYLKASTLMEESLSLRRARGDTHGIADSLSSLGDVLLLQGQGDRAKAVFRECLDIFQQLGDKSGIADCFQGLAAAAALQGDPTRAARLAGAAATLRKVIGGHDWPHLAAYHVHMMDAARTQLAEAVWAVAWTTGQSMTQNQALTYALESD